MSFSRLFSTHKPSLLRGTFFVGWMGGMAYLAAKLDEQNLAEFKQQYPGEKPKSVFHPVSGVGGYWTYERDEKNAPSSPSPKR